MEQAWTIAAEHPLARVLFLPSLHPAGSYGTWATQIVMKAADIRAGGRLALARRWGADWGPPQWDRPFDPNYTTISSTGKASLEFRFERVEAWHPWDRVLYVRVSRGRLLPGDSVTIVYGDRSGGSPGARAQTFIEEASGQSVRIDPQGTGSWVEIGTTAVEIIGGPISRLVAVGPSKVRLGEEFELLIRAEDEWGNPASGYSGFVEICGVEVDPLHFGPAGRGVVRTAVSLPATGVHRLTVLDRVHGLMATSNPIQCVPGSLPSRTFWGDIHAQSEIGCGSRSIANYFAHARDFSGLDFASHQANDFLVSNSEWEETQAVTAEFNKPSHFVSLLGIEWSGETSVGGDRNLYFPHDREPIRRSSHRHVTDHSDIDTDLPTIRDVHQKYQSTNTLIVPHVGGRTSDLQVHDGHLERLIEIHSTHATSEWFLADALTRGMRVGVTGGSDGIDGRPGNSHPGDLSVRNLRGGLVAVEMPELTREALWQALHNRRCYATTGERILLEVNVEGHRMGSEFEIVHAPSIKISVEGTAPLESVAIYRGLEQVFSAPLIDAVPSRRDLIRIAWRGATQPGNWQRARLTWDGEATLASGTIRNARGYAFDSPAEGLRSVAPDRVSWRSITAGDWDGIILEIDGAPSARLCFRSAPASFDLPLSQLEKGPHSVIANGFRASVEVRYLPAELPLAWHGSFRDESIEAGVNPYWIHVRQEDGSQAWSSPVYIHYAHQ